MCKTPRLLCSPWLLSQPFAPWLVKTSQSLRCGKIELCCSNLPLVCEREELPVVLCSPSIFFRRVKPSCRQDRRIIKFVWSGKGRTPQTACEIAHQETGSLTTKENVRSQRDSESLTLVHWYVPLCPIDFVKTRFAAWTNCQDCRGILGMSTRTSACFAPFHMHKD